MRIPLIPERPTLRPPTAGPLLGKQVLVLAPLLRGDVRGIKQLWHVLRPLGVRVAVATEEQGELIGEDKRQLVPDLLVIEAHPEAWDAIVVAGGGAADTMAADPEMRALVEQFRAAGRFVGAIGSGAAVLARAGVDGVVRESAEELAPALLNALQRARPGAGAPA